MTPGTAPAAVLWSGGKDSTLALQRALGDGVRVTTLFNLYDEASARVRFHGVRRELIQAQADALGLDLIQCGTAPDTFEAVFQAGLAELVRRGVNTLVLGNIHLADVRAWYEERTAAAGLAHVEPLWGWRPDRVVDEFVRAGYRARITGVDTSVAPTRWLGHDIDAGLITEFRAAGIDVAGERGEYHSFVHDGPRFTRPIAIRNGAIRDETTHAFMDVQGV
ncbi:MAG TPA: diphthine--ammonia ligase [Longimicrobiales bacterium]|nr:diphthine--ammonia ligase [Longimicrobiales bacterium]